MPRHPVILFDLDGTLLDSIRFIVDCYHRTLQIHGLPPVPDAHWLSGVGRPLREQLRPFAGDEVHLAALVDTYRQWNAQEHDHRVRAFPGVPEALRGAGARLGVVTSKMHQTAERGLQVMGVQDLIEVVIGSDDVERHKPDPAPVTAALDRLGAPARGAIMVGDSIVDLRAGRAAGTEVAAVLWGVGSREELAPAADRVFTEPSELTRLA